MKLFKSINDSGITVKPEDEHQFRIKLGKKFEIFGDIYFYNTEKWAYALGGNVAFEILDNPKTALSVGYKVDSNQISSLFTGESYDSAELEKIADQLANEPKKMRPSLLKADIVSVAEDAVKWFNEFRAKDSNYCRTFCDLLNDSTVAYVEGVKKILKDANVTNDEIYITSRQPQQDHFLKIDDGEIQVCCKKITKEDLDGMFVEFMGERQEFLHEQVKKLYRETFVSKNIFLKSNDSSKAVFFNSNSQSSEEAPAETENQNMNCDQENYNLK